ncbi:MAG: TlpA family protein disulfide reductase [Prosthecobacter sp.]|jgi:peroxiredoxin|uniref:peroxiredoxin family protein n=1 Tax=Prosthecobacter sp. TaxID=1965333 RepID=UPI0019E03829|nr:TlpA disulfide reductase family protein [Prosthecobacter sp.]MBE2282452.1 TlpA family protein disulfide reductase [Prosthecobacter sp.]
MPIRRLITVLTALVLFSSAVFAEEVDQAVRDATLVKLHETAPDFACRMMDGREFKLSAMRGKVVVLYFFASSVPFSFTEMRYLETEVLQKLGRRDDLAILCIARGHTREEVVTMAGEKKLALPMAADPQQECYQRYFSKFVPRTVVVRRDGTVVHLASGYREHDGIVELREVLRRELAAKRP